MPEGRELDQAALNLVSAAAHDLKTPLVFIRGAAAQLGSDQLSESQRVTQLNRIEQSAGRLLTLIDSLIGSAQAEQQQLALEPVQTEQVIYQALEDISPYAHELGFNFNVKLSRHLPPVLSHRSALRRILFNLLDNAIKYTQDRHDIDIQARRDRDHIRITVRDWGVGVRGSDLEQIWRLFGRAAAPSNAMPGSSGLGLYIASSLSRNLSAELNLKTLSKGTAFYLRLPVANQLSLF